MQGVSDSGLIHNFIFKQIGSRFSVKAGGFFFYCSSSLAMNLASNLVESKVRHAVGLSFLPSITVLIATGVVLISHERGVAWNGLSAVSESPSGAEASPIYADNIKYQVGKVATLPTSGLSGSLSMTVTEYFR